MVGGLTDHVEALGSDDGGVELEGGAQQAQRLLQHRHLLGVVRDVPQRHLRNRGPSAR
jgi:hypothetical protein